MDKNGYYILGDKGEYNIRYIMNDYQPKEILVYAFDFELFNNDIQHLKNTMKVLENNNNYIKEYFNAKDRIDEK